MGSLLLNAEKTPAHLKCLIRGNWVRATPEERVRQALLWHMIESLGYPKQLIAVEQSLKKLPYASYTSEKPPSRRADVLCYLPTLAPLLLMECKALDISTKCQRQLIGYNCYVKAPFIGFATPSQLILGSYCSATCSYSFSPNLPRYDALVS